MERVAGYGIRPEVVPSVRQAVELALAEAEPDEVVLACGSLFVVAEARAVATTPAALADEPMSD